MNSTIVPPAVQPYIIALEGNIGAGKTTFLRHIRQYYRNIVVIDEPVDTWESIIDPCGKNILQYFYGDMARWSYTFQNAALLTRIQNIERAVAENPHAHIFLMERSYLTDRNVFAKMLYEDGKISDIEMKLYKMWYDHFTSRYPIRTILWLNTDVPTCLSRIRMRNRRGEEDIAEDYLQRLDKAHHTWLTDDSSEHNVITIPDGATVEEKCMRYIEPLYQSAMLSP